MWDYLLIRHALQPLAQGQDPLFGGGARDPIPMRASSSQSPNSYSGGGGGGGGGYGAGDPDDGGPPDRPPTGPAARRGPLPAADEDEDRSEEDALGFPAAVFRCPSSHSRSELFALASAALVRWLRSGARTQPKLCHPLLGCGDGLLGQETHAEGGRQPGVRRGGPQRGPGRLAMGSPPRSHRCPAVILPRFSPPLPLRFLSPCPLRALTLPRDGQVRGDG